MVWGLTKEKLFAILQTSVNGHKNGGNIIFQISGRYQSYIK